MERLPPTPAGIARAAEVIRAGGVVAYPTETVYGLAVNPFCAEAVERLFAVKERDPRNPVLLIVADSIQLAEVVAEVTPAAAACIARFWPGPLSLLFPKSPRLPLNLTAGHAKVCVRQTSCETARALCLAAGCALTSSSANLSGRPPARTADEAALPGVDVLLDAGELAPSTPSTVFDPDTATVLREGVVPMATLSSCVLKSPTGR